MFSNLLNRCLHLSSSTSGKSCATPKPAIEALEERSLLDANAFVRGLYTDILHRPSPTDAEVNGWVSQIQNGMSLQQVAMSFAGSNERFGLVVNDDYTRILGRSADPDGLNFWTQQLASGAMTEQQVQANILATEESFTHNNGTDQGFIIAAFNTALRRNADEVGMDFYMNQMNNGASRLQVATEIVGSHEAHLRDVDQIYLEMLHRNADDLAYAHFGNQLDNGGSEMDVEATVTSSNEYQAANGGVFA